MTEASSEFPTAHVLLISNLSRAASQTAPTAAADGGVNFTDEQRDMQRDTRRLPHDKYLRLAMSHRFCLVAPGDFISTHKVSEAMALGGAGGCIPVFVLPSVRTPRPRAGKLQEPPVPDQDRVVDVANHLPYTRWLDYCGVAFFVAERYAREAMGEVLGLLAAVPEAELQAKRRRLRRVRSAFTFRRGASLAEPSAAEHILSEVCHAARAARSAEEARLRGERSPPLTPVGGDHSRCVLLGERRRRRPRGAWTRWPGKNPNSPTGGLVPGGYSFRLGK